MSREHYIFTEKKINAELCFLFLCYPWLKRVVDMHTVFQNSFYLPEPSHWNYRKTNRKKCTISNLVSYLTEILQLRKTKANVCFPRGKSEVFYACVLRLSPHHWLLFWYCGWSCYEKVVLSPKGIRWGVFKEQNMLLICHIRSKFCRVLMESGNCLLCFAKFFSHASHVDHLLWY